MPLSRNNGLIYVAIPMSEIKRAITGIIFENKINSLPDIWFGVNYFYEFIRFHSQTLNGRR